MNQKEKIKKYRESIQVEASEEKYRKQFVKSKNAVAEQNSALIACDFVDTASCDTKKVVGSSIL